MTVATTAPGSRLVDREVLQDRLRFARADLERCDWCEWRCGANRVAGDPAPCHLGDETYCFKHYVSYGDEAELVPTYRVYLAGCNFRCRFCNTAPGCFEPCRGARVDPGGLAAECSAHVRSGVKTIDLLGGEPTLHVHTLLELALAADEPLPLAVDSNMYMTPEVLGLLDGVAALYLADFKFGNDDCAERLAGVPRYFEVVTRNLALVFGRTPLIIRHLQMPNHVECCFRPVVDWVVEHLPGVRFQLHTGYVPCWRAGADASINRLNADREVAAARAYALARGLRLGPSDETIA